jgi:hypothetical protein
VAGTCRPGGRKYFEPAALCKVSIITPAFRPAIKRCHEFERWRRLFWSPPVFRLYGRRTVTPENISCPPPPTYWSSPVSTASISFSALDKAVEAGYHALQADPQIGLRPRPGQTYQADGTPPRARPSRKNAIIHSWRNGLLPRVRASVHLGSRRRSSLVCARASSSRPA